MPFALRPTATSPHRLALRLALSFIGAGLVWVFATDVLLYQLTDDLALIARVETAKGWLFVASIAVLLYYVAYRAARRLDHARATTAAVIESIGDGVLLLSSDRRVIYANDAAVRMLHCGAASELIGMGGQEFTQRFRVTRPDGSVVRPTSLVSQRVFDEGGTLRYKCVLHPPGHPDVVIDAIAAPVVDRASPTPPMVVSVMHDITDSERIHALRDTFLSFAAHALKTPVTIIGANAHVLATASDGQRERAIAAIVRQCARLDRLVQNLLVLSRARSRTLELRPRDLDLAALAATTVTELASDTSAGARVTTELTASPHVLGDAERMRVAITNLIDSALRSAPHPPDVTVFVQQEGDDAKLGVRYHPSPPDGLRPIEWEDLGVARSAATAIIESHGGTFHEDRTADTATAWFRLPALA